MRRILSCVAAALLLQFAACQESPLGVQIVVGRDPVVPEPMHVRESDPVEVKKARFVVVAEADWKLGEEKKARPIETQLRITNLAETDLVFPTTFTFGPSLKTMDGTAIHRGGGNNHIVSTRPVSIPRGAYYSICRKAELRWDAADKAAELVYWDGNGGEYYFGPLVPGKYKLSFWYDTAKCTQPPAYWAGNASTKDVIVEVFDH
jgi:hypothetical protein